MRIRIILVLLVVSVGALNFVKLGQRYSVENTPPPSLPSSANQIHIQFEGTPIFNSMLKTKTGRTSLRTVYTVISNGTEKEEFSFEEIKVKKSITYRTHSNKIVLRRYIDLFQFQEFLLHKGDSVLLDFDVNKPLKVIHSTYQYNSQDFDLERFINEKHPELYSTVGKADDLRMTSFKFFYDDPKESVEQRKRTDENKANYIEALQRRMAKDLLPSMREVQIAIEVTLHSLAESKRISSNVHDFYANKYANLLLKLEIMAETEDNTTAAQRLNEAFDSKQFVEEYLDQCLYSFGRVYYKANIVKYGMGHIKDPRDYFRSLLHSSLLQPALKERLLFKYLEEINGYYPEETASYLSSFVENTTDKALVERAIVFFKKEEAPSNVVSNLHLISLSQQKTTIEEVVQQKSDKILYLDLWASWCGPCIAEMKHSRALRDEYKDKNVEVLFVSLDDNTQKWMDASKKQEISEGNCFKVIDPKEASFLATYKVATIPRYMIIGKDGKVINADAPRPSDPKLRALFDELLKK
jgi:thiol-disulfide isomerase/thioredoxin